MIIAGIGARATPPDVLQIMEQAGALLAMRGHTGRSGGAEGADTAFERGMNMIRAGACKVFPGHIGHYVSWRDHAAKFHPAWDKCNEAARNLHARNSAIICGPSLDEPVQAVLCWTVDGAVTGGTGQGLRIAAAYNIPVFNLAVTNVTALYEWVSQ